MEEHIAIYLCTKYFDHTKVPEQKKSRKKLIFVGHPLKLKNLIVTSMFLSKTFFLQFNNFANWFAGQHYLDGITGNQIG